jgi:hypothetical protein
MGEVRIKRPFTREKKYLSNPNMMIAEGSLKKREYL